MKLLGFQIPNFTYPGVRNEQLFDRIVQLATTAERSGFDSVFVMDHFYQIGGVGPRTDPMLEAYTLLGGIAAGTQRAKLGTLVTGVTYRNPALLAKEITTLDIVSKGRAILGIGAAWNEDEHKGYGFDFPPIKERMDRLEEALQICKLMFTHEKSSFNGKYYKLHDALNYPQPVQPGGPKIMIGGGGERRTLKLVAQYADICNFFGDVNTIEHKLSVLDEHCQAVGRDPNTIIKTRLGSMIIRDSQAEAERALQERMKVPGVNPDWVRMGYLTGGPDKVAEEAQKLLDAGLDGLIFNMPHVEDLHAIELAGKTLSGLREPARAR